MGRNAPAVYLVEDDDAVLSALRFAFEVEGLQVRAYRSGEALLADVECPETGCLVIDHFMPAITGLDLLRLLRSRGCRIPAILITTQASAGMRRRARALGVDLILEKPLSDSSLVDRAREVLGDAPP